MATSVEYLQSIAITAVAMQQHPNLGRVDSMELAMELAELDHALASVAASLDDEPEA